MSTKTFSLEGGKYEFDRNSIGLLVAARRNSEPWPEGLDQFQFAKAFHAALNRIEQLEESMQQISDYAQKDGDMIAQHLAGIARAAIAKQKK